MTAMILFGRFAQQAQYSAIDGQLGAAAAVLQNMRGDWTVTPAVAGNRTMDVVHRAVGKPGVVLVGEGVPTRVAALIAAERKKTERVAHGVPIHEFQVGNGEGQIPVSKLQRKITTLPRTLRPTAVSDLNYRLKALQPTMQMPKGPMPKGARSRGCPSRARPARRAVRTTIVSAARSCRPRRSRSVRQAGMTNSRSRVRSAAHLKPGPAAVGADRADAEQPLADGEPADRGEQVDLDDEQQQGGPLGVAGSARR